MPTDGTNSSEPVFRAYCKNFFVTWPKCFYSPTAANEILLSMHKDLSAITIGAEKHADGSPHLHGVLSFPGRKNIRSCRAFDIGSFHGKIEAVRNLKNSLAYVKKDGEFCSSHSEANTRVPYGEIIERASGREEFLNLVLANHPRDAVLQWTRLNIFADWRFNNPIEYNPPDNVIYNPPSAVDDWIKNEVESICVDCYIDGPCYNCTNALNKHDLFNERNQYLYPPDWRS